MKATLKRITIKRPQRGKHTSECINRTDLGKVEISGDYMEALIPFIYGRTVKELADQIIAQK